MASSISTTLPEISPKDASGAKLEIYQSIEKALGVRLVNLVYRHLATIPGALEWAWAVVGDGFHNKIYEDRSAPLACYGMRLADVADNLPTISLKGCGLTKSDSAAVFTTIDAYNRANPINALSLRVIALSLTAGWRAPAVRTTIKRPETSAELLPMGDLQNLDREMSKYMSRLTIYVNGMQSDLVPSLFRHFIPWPSLLAAVCDLLKPLHEDGFIAQSSVQIARQAESIAKDIFRNLDEVKHTLAPPDEDIRMALTQTIDQFLPAICRMIAIGGLLKSSISFDPGK